MSFSSYFLISLLSMASSKLPGPLMYLLPCPGTGKEGESQYLHSCLAHSLILRLSIAILVFHLLIMTLLMLCNAQFLNKFCFLGKIMMIIALFIGSFYLDVSVFKTYFKIACVLSFPYLVYSIGVQWMDLAYKIGIRISRAYFDLGYKWAKFALIIPTAFCTIYTFLNVYNIFQAGFKILSLSLGILLTCCFLMSGVLRKFS